MYGTGTFIITNFNFLTTSSPKNINRQKSVVFYITMLHTVFVFILLMVIHIFLAKQIPNYKMY